MRAEELLRVRKVVDVVRPRLEVVVAVGLHFFGVPPHLFVLELGLDSTGEVPGATAVGVGTVPPGV